MHGIIHRGYLELELLTREDLVQRLLHENVSGGESPVYPTPTLTFAATHTILFTPAPWGWPPDGTLSSICMLYGCVPLIHMQKSEDSCVQLFHSPHLHVGFWGWTEPVRNHLSSTDLAVLDPFSVAFLTYLETNAKQTAHTGWKGLHLLTGSQHNAG